MKIVVLDGNTVKPNSTEWEDWADLGVTMDVYLRTDSSQTVARCKDADMILTNKVLITAEIMAQLPQLKYIGVLATGYNVVDIQAAAQRGIVVTNIPAYSTSSVAQMVFAHLLNITQHVAAHSDAVHQGRWTTSPDFCFWDYPLLELAGLTIGIYGLGNTGTATARIALAMGMKVLVYSSKSLTDVQQILGSDSVAKADTLQQFFAQSDVVSLHCPLTDATRHLINKDTLQLMKPSAILINTGRGPLVDEEALATALKEGTIYAAGIDVLTQEAPRNGSPLFGVPNCYITPHIAWATIAAIGRLLSIAKQNVQAFMAGQSVNRIV